MSLFRGVSAKQLKQIVPLFNLEEHPVGTTIFGMGNPGDKVQSLARARGQLSLLTEATSMRLLSALTPRQAWWRGACLCCPHSRPGMRAVAVACTCLYRCAQMLGWC